jgi:4-hydroxybenzoate polyprenyltransferase
MLILLWALALVEGLGWISMAGVGVVAALLAYEHRLVKPHDFSRINAAFFTTNGYISVLFFVFWTLDLALLR